MSKATWGDPGGGQIGHPQHHTTPLQDQWMLATCSSLLLSLILSSSRLWGGVETNRACICLTCMMGSSGSVGACGYKAWRRCLWSVCCLVAAPPWEQTHAVLHHFCYLIQQRVFCCHHTCSLVQETSIWTEQGIPQCPQMCWCVCFPVWCVKCVCMIAINMSVGHESIGHSGVWLFFFISFAIFSD